MKFTTTERPSLETVLTRSAAVSGLSMSVMPSIASEAAHDVAHGGGDLADHRRALALDEHLLAGLLGEARGRDEHVAALGLAAARRGLVDLVLADPPADDGGEDDEHDPAEDGRLAVLRAPSTGSCREIAGLIRTCAPSGRRGRTASSLPATPSARPGCSQASRVTLVPGAQEEPHRARGPGPRRPGR